ncbi:hypothetical protein VHUM_03967 [Vanrija humicola]|uniref:Mediator of RNA polymerase II transcription subunit 11 n=1 Tax=Vanrija humicola TaxID=5417 RepID=A0A7D8YZZ5_VANHU|nr:hypothetical protein VHUM_03967 [Vanrija humicola]
MAQDEPAWADPLIIDGELDTDTLLTALGNVEKEIPNLLLDVKPVIAHLASGGGSAAEDEAGGVAAREGVERYMRNLDNIQVILRQAVYFLRETRAAPSVLRPPALDGIPRPLAATLAQPAVPTSVGSGETTLGLYAARTEVAALRDMLAAAKALRREEEREKAGEGAGGDDGDGLVEIDAEP